MNLLSFFRSALDEDKSPIVICDLNHLIIYMNPSACQRYKGNLVGKCLMNCHNAKSREMIEKVIAWFQESCDNNRIYTYRNDDENKDVYMIALRDESGELIGYYEKHEYRNRETESLYNFK